MRRIAVIGVPTNSSGTKEGVALAPEVLRRLGLIEALSRHNQVVDFGNVQLPPPSPKRSQSGIIAEDALVDMVFAVSEAVGNALYQNYFPLVLGGDCPLLIGCLAACRTKKTALVFADGHEDAYPPKKSPTGEAADMELGLILGREIDLLPERLRQILPLLKNDQVIVLGARDRSILQNEGVGSIADTVSVLTDADLKNIDLADFSQKTIARLAKDNAQIWYHIDLDVLSTSCLSAVDYRQAGGLSFQELVKLSRPLLASEKLAGWNITIYNPDLDPDLTSGRAIVDFIESVLA